MTDLILLRHDAGHIATLTLNTPQNLNALSAAMIAALQVQIAALATDASIRVVILRGAGKVFCAGHDLKEMQAARGNADQGRGYFTRLFNDCAAMMQALIALPQPVIAAVQGIATAGGCQLRYDRGRRYGPLWRERREHRSVLLYPHGGADPQSAPCRGV